MNSQENCMEKFSFAFETLKVHKYSTARDIPTLYVHAQGKVNDESKCIARPFCKYVYLCFWMHHEIE